MSGFIQQVSAISPLGDAIDGRVKPKPQRKRGLMNRGPRERLDASATFFCSKSAV